MGKVKNKKSGSKRYPRKSRIVEIANTLEWLITAFVLAFVFRTFIMEAFRIPTGSMANTLMGAHFRLRCSQCGYKYNHGFNARRYGPEQGYLREGPSRCPSCGNHQTTGGTIPAANGDRILVLKCLYQFVEPKQWDVVVFKNPLEPSINYIKRLVGRPEETVEIIDGDIYIDGQISRKPPKIQDGLWMLIYDNDYQPVRAREPTFNGHAWQQPFKNINGSKWKFDKAHATQFYLDSPVEQIHTLIYDSSIGNDFRAVYAYNDAGDYDYRPYCSDLIVHFYVESTEPQGVIGIAVSKYQNVYRAWVDFTGDMVITKSEEGRETVELARKSIEPPAVSKAAFVKFANVDHQLVFEFGDEKLSYDLGRGPDDAGERKPDIQPKVKIFGAGKLTLSHTTIFRDTHYTSKKYVGSSQSGRATEGNSFRLGKDEFFVLGDNSPNSEDGRWWGKEGLGNNGRFYRKGIVPREYLVGKALFVYWPSGFRPFDKFRFGIIPNIGQMRFIYGGKNKKPVIGD